MTSRQQDLTLERLRERRSAKWTHYDADVLPAWVAEMDLPLAEPINEALAHALEIDDSGYADADAAGLGRGVRGVRRPPARLERRPGAGDRRPRRRPRALGDGRAC